jgi:hypothetical protein
MLHLNAASAFALPVSGEHPNGSFGLPQAVCMTTDAQSFIGVLGKRLAARLTKASV